MKRANKTLWGLKAILFTGAAAVAYATVTSGQAQGQEIPITIPDTVDLRPGGPDSGDATAGNLPDVLGPAPTFASPTTPDGTYTDIDDGYAYGENQNSQVNRNSSVQSDDNENVIEVELNFAAHTGTDVDEQAENNRIDSIATGNQATNITGIGTALQDQDSYKFYDPSSGPVQQLNRQNNIETAVTSNANSNDIFVDFDTAGVDGTSVIDNDLSISGNDIDSKAYGNRASSAFLGDLRKTAKNGIQAEIPGGGIAAQGSTFRDGDVYTNLSGQFNRGTPAVPGDPGTPAAQSTIMANATGNEMIINLGGARIRGLDGGVDGNTISAGAFGNDASNSTGFTTDGDDSPVIAQKNVQQNMLMTISSVVTTNTLKIDQMDDTRLDDSIASVSNNRLMSSATGNRSVNRFGGLDLGGSLTNENSGN